MTSEGYAESRTVVKNLVCENLIKAGVLLRNEVTNYTETLDSYNEMTLFQVLTFSLQLRVAGETLTNLCASDFVQGDSGR